jgi:hypothetical protein
MMENQQETSSTQSFRSSDFPATEFFLRLSEGTKCFRDKDFEKAISKWEEAARMRPDYESAMRILGSVSYQGSLDDVPLVGLFYALSSNFQTGVVIVRKDNAHKEVYFRDGSFSPVQISQRRALVIFWSREDLSHNPMLIKWP